MDDDDLEVYIASICLDEFMKVTRGKSRSYVWTDPIREMTED